MIVFELKIRERLPTGLDLVFDVGGVGNTTETEMHFSRVFRDHAERVKQALFEEAKKRNGY